MIHSHGLWGPRAAPPQPLFGRLHIPGGFTSDDPGTIPISDPEPIGYDENGNPIYADPFTPP